ncbi:MAG TPA: NADH-quinone oxidoreductase subunit L, partial [Candidatus Lustribacter sp.]|nr:NADH-quinone oxidoreductase subunit L [Candidatus Lustribacter sp.]
IGSLAAGALAIPLNLLVTHANAASATVVAIVGAGVQLYSIWYLADDKRYGAFAATVSMFTAAMLLVVMSGDLVLTLIGWEVMGWGSYLLIGHLTAKESARRAAVKAFLVTRFADIGFVLGVVMLAVAAGTTQLSKVLVTTGAAVTTALVLLLMGVAGKSGLVPFHDWLPDAMEGPTPASALIHGATMVAAGTVVVSSLFPLYAEHPPARAVLAVLTSVTMVWAALLAFGQSDLKRMLAYSTLSQVAIMLSALSVAPLEVGPGAGLGHLYGHAFFKALLFLGAGWLAAVVGAGTAFAGLRGRLAPRSALGLSMAVGLASLAGVPPLVGFFSKETVVGTAEESALNGGGLAAWLVLVALLVTIPLTAAYATRAWLVLAGARRPAGVAEPVAAAQPVTAGHDEHGPVGRVASYTVIALALFTVLGGLLLVLARTGVHLAPVTTVLALVLVAVAGVLVYRRYAASGEDPALALGARTLERADAGYGMDSVYVRVATWTQAAGRLVVALDRDVVDAYPRAASRATVLLGRGLD